MSTEKAMKPAMRKVPALVKFGFIALEIAVLIVGATYIHLGSDTEHQVLGDVNFWLAFTLLASAVALYFYDRRLADYGIVAVVLWILMGLFRPVY